MTFSNCDHSASTEPNSLPTCWRVGVSERVEGRVSSGEWWRGRGVVKRGREIGRRMVREEIDGRTQMAVRQSVNPSACQCLVAMSRDACGHGQRAIRGPNKLSSRLAMLQYGHASASPTQLEWSGCTASSCCHLHAAPRLIDVLEHRAVEAAEQHSHNARPANRPHMINRRRSRR